MKRLLILFAIVVSFTSLSFGQTDEKSSKRPNFSGVWLLDESRVDDKYNKEIDDLVRKEYETQKLTLKITVVLKIVHNDPEMIITGARLREVFDASGKLVERVPTEIPQLTIYTDGRAEVTAPDNQHEANARSKWDGHTVVRTIQFDNNRPTLWGTTRVTARNGKTIYYLENNAKELVVEQFMEAYEEASFSSGTIRSPRRGDVRPNRAGATNLTRRVYTLVEQQDQ